MSWHDRDEATTDRILDAAEAIPLDEAIGFLAEELRLTPAAVADRLARLVHRQAIVERLRSMTTRSTRRR